MVDKVNVINQLVAKLRPFIKDSEVDDVRMNIDLVLYPFDIIKAERELVPYQQNETEEAIQNFIASKIAKGCSKRTIKMYIQTLHLVFNKLQIPYDQVTPNDLRLYLAKRVNVEGVSKVGADNERRVLSSFYNWLRDDEILLKNPMAKVDCIKRPKLEKHAFSHMEIEKLRTACRSNRETALIEVLLSTWARASEVAMIRLDEIKDDRILIHGKGDKERTVYLNPKAMLAIERYMAERKDKNPYLFPAMGPALKGSHTSASGKEKSKIMKVDWYTHPELVDPEKPCDYGSLNAIVRNMGKRAGVPKTHMHRFRRTGATFALQTGMPVLTVSKLLGHSSIDTTQLYLDISDVDLRNAHAKFVV